MLDESLLDKNRKYLVGVSGGVDSMALLDMLVKKAYNVIVVHYNYHFREDSDLDENLVRSYCQNHHLLHLHHPTQIPESHSGAELVSVLAFHV